MKPHVMFITAGEWPARKGLLVSQVYETARFLKDRGHEVSWFASIPFLSRMKRWVLRDHDLQDIVAACADNGIAFKYVITPVTLGSPWSLPLRRAFHRRLAAQARQFLRSRATDDRSKILHARSYHAAEIAVMLRDLLQQDAAAAAIASFDMRSFLGPESPMGHGALGVAHYGFVKQMEFDLIRESDTSFVPVQVARRHYEEETGLRIQFAPIQGLERDPAWAVDFGTRWAAKRIGYSGSIGQWHDPALLKRIFALFPGFKPKLATRTIPEFAELDCAFYDHSELPSYYDSLLALVIPGLSEIGDYYRTLQMRCNLFSTKAAEALSRGVPLIVSSELHELADFVRQNGCGMVVDVRAGVPSLPPGADIGSSRSWEEMTHNAARVGENFTRQAVMGIYERAWASALERRRP